MENTFNLKKFLAEGKLLKEEQDRMDIFDDIDTFVDSDLYDSEEDDFSNLKNFLKSYPQYVGQEKKILSRLYAPIKVQRFKGLNENSKVNIANFLNRKLKEGGTDNPLAVALDIADEDLAYYDNFKEFTDDDTDITLISGNGLLISDDEDDIETQADAMETSYDEIEVDGRTLYFIYDPN